MLRGTGTSLAFPGALGSAGLTSELIDFFLATSLARLHDGGGDAHENITVHDVPLETDCPKWLAEQTAAGKDRSTAAECTPGNPFLLRRPPIRRLITGRTLHAPARKATAQPSIDETHVIIEPEPNCRPAIVLRQLVVLTGVFIRFLAFSAAEGESALLSCRSFWLPLKSLTNSPSMSNLCCGVAFK